MVDALGLGGYRDKLIKELSTGTRRIVDLACVLIQRPTVVLLDEPSSGIAQRETEALGPLLLACATALGCALVLIEHDMPLLLGVAERCTRSRPGRVIASGKPQDVVRHPEVVRSYLGDDPAPSSGPARSARAERPHEATEPLMDIVAARPRRSAWPTRCSRWASCSIYMSNRVINLAHGEFGAFAVAMMLALTRTAHLNYWLALLLQPRGDGRARARSIERTSSAGCSAARG